MQRFSFRTISLVLKFLAVMIGAYGAVLGFLVAVLGLSIECNPPPLWARLLYAVILLEGVAYCLPNVWITKTRKRITGYFVFTALPVLFTILYFAIAAHVEGFFDYWTEVKIGAATVLALLLAPFSLIFTLLNDRKQRSMKAPGG